MTVLTTVFHSAAGGEIFDYCDCDELLPEGQITRLIRQMLEGVHLLHQTSVVHLDLKVCPSTPLNAHTHRLVYKQKCTAHTRIQQHVHTPKIHFSTLFAPFINILHHHLHIYILPE